MKRLNRNYCHGQVAIIVAISLIVLVGMIGLAIDSGRGYGVKAKLSAAVDAAAIAAGRALVEGETDAVRIDNAKKVAQRFFNGNFPTDYLGINPAKTVLMTDAVHMADGYWKVSVSASAEMPTTFMRALGKDKLVVAAVGEAIRRDVDIMLVMDASGSLGPPTSPSTTLPKLKECAKNAFVSKFIAGAGGDRLGFVSFASGAVLNVPINKDATRGFSKTAVNNAIDGLNASGWTSSAEAMRLALNELIAIPASTRASLRVIVFFSDGAPNGVPGTFTRTSGNPRTVSGILESGTSGSGTERADEVYRANVLNDNNPASYTNISVLPNTGSTITGVGGIPLAGTRTLALSGGSITNTRCNVNKASRNMVENVANTTRNQGIFVHVASLGTRVSSLETSFSGGNCGYNSSDFGSVVLKRIANSTDSTTYNSSQPIGLYVPAANIEDCEAAFSKIASEILRLTR